MRKVLFFMLCCAMGPLALAQTHFRTISFEEALAAAKQEQKKVFIDFYTSWCGPCKKMSSEVFNQVGVGKYFNETFVNLKVDAEKGEGVVLAKKYQIKAYPTFVVLDVLGNEIYRTSGASPATDFVDKIRKGIDPEWSPDALSLRYENGERTPELVNEYILLQMERGDEKSGWQLVQAYFDGLSDRKRVKPENFFLYSRYTLNFKDPKADYMFAHKERFIKANGKEFVERLLYNWLRQEIIPFITVKGVPVTDDNERALQGVGMKIRQAALEHSDRLNVLNELAHVRWQGDLKAYLNVCREKFALLEARDRFIILLDFGFLKEKEGEIKQMAVALIRNNLDEVGGFENRVLYRIMLELEGMKEYALRASIDEVEKGKVSVSYFRQGEMETKEYSFDNHVIDFRVAGKDTLTASMRILCDELASPTARGNNYYPHFNFMIVPGEFAVVRIKAERGKATGLKWEKGGDVSRDYVRLNYNLLEPDERSYNQLTVDNIIRGGDIRDYPNEFQASWDAGRRRIMKYIRENIGYISMSELCNHYNWFDENEVEEIYHRFPGLLKSNPFGRLVEQRLNQSRDFRIGCPAKKFEKKDMNGKVVSLERLKGMYVLLDFWGSWCAPCRASHPHLKELYKKYGTRIVFINVAQENVKDLEEARELWKAAVKEDGMTWVQILNNEEREKSDMVRLFNITSFPTKILIDPRGIIISRMVGGMVDVEHVLEKCVTN